MKKIILGFGLIFSSVALAQNQVPFDVLTKNIHPEQYNISIHCQIEQAQREPNFKLIDFAFQLNNQCLNQLIKNRTMLSNDIQHIFELMKNRPSQYQSLYLKPELETFHEAILKEWDEKNIKAIQNSYLKMATMSAQYGMDTKLVKKMEELVNNLISYLQLINQSEIAKARFEMLLKFESQQLKH